MPSHAARLAGIVLLALALSGSGAQQPANRNAADAARATVDSFFADIDAERWSAAAQRLDLRDFAPYLRRTIVAARGQLPSPPPTVAELMAQDSTLPRAVAEWQIEQGRRVQRETRFHDFSDQFAGVTTFAALASLSVPDAAARWLEARDFRTRMRAYYQRQPCADSALTAARLQATRSVSTERQTILAFALRDDSTAYVIHASSQVDDRRRNAGMDAMPPAVMTLRREGSRWLIVPHEGFLQARSGGLYAVSISCGEQRRR